MHAQGGMALVCACREGRTAIVPLLLDAGADVHADDDRALRDASGYGQLRVVAALLAAGANVHAKDDEALARAARFGYDAVVAQLLTAGADVRSCKYRAIKWALQSPHVANPQERQDLLAPLAAAGAATWSIVEDVGDAASSQTRFLAFVNQLADLERRLEAACERGDAADVATVLSTPTLARYVDVDEGFCRACRQGHEAVVARLIAAGADVHYGCYDGYGGSYVGPLLEACEAGHVDVVAVLVAAGANVNMLDGAPLKIACKFGHVVLLDWLLEHGADVHAQEDETLRTAAEYGQAQAIARLLAAGATINIGRGPVRAAVSEGQEDVDLVAIVRQLVDAGANLAMVDDDSSLALAAGFFGSLPLVELLLRAGANVHARNDEALVDACKYGRFAVVECLTDAGANVACADWAHLPERERARIALRVRTADAMALPRWMRLVRSLHLVRVRRPLRGALTGARNRLDRPPSSTLGTESPTREQLIAHLKTAGRRFAREYWAEGLPLFLKKGAELGPVPDEFLAKPLAQPR